MLARIVHAALDEREPAQQAQRAGIARVRRRDGLGPHDRLRQVALLVSGAGEPELPADIGRLEPEHALKMLARLLEKKVVEAALAEQQQQRNVVG